MQVQCLSSLPGPRAGSTLKHWSVLNALCPCPFPLCCYLSVMSSMLRATSLPVQVTVCLCMQSNENWIISFFVVVTSYLFSNVMKLLACERQMFLVQRLWWCPQMLRIRVWSGDGIFRCPMVSLWKHSTNFSSLYYLEESAVTIREKKTYCCEKTNTEKDEEKSSALSCK